jgi:hypothetical protein
MNVVQVFGGKKSSHAKAQNAAAFQDFLCAFAPLREKHIP